MKPKVRLISTQKAATRLDVSENTIRRMIEDPDNPLKGCRLFRSVIRVIEDSIEDAIKSGMEDFLRQS